MASSKAHQVDAYLSRPPQHRIILVYGPDGGLVSERAARLVKTSEIDLADPFATVKLDADDAAAEPGRIYEEASTISMFGGQRLVWVRGSTQRNLARSVQPVLDEPPVDALVIIEAGDLKPVSALRKAIEKSDSGMALPCYRDENAALDTMIDEELREAGLAIDRDARQSLKACLGGDRLASRGEVRKLALYAAGDGTITEDHVAEVVGDASIGAMDQFVDAVATGRARDAEGLFKGLMEAGTTSVALAGALQRHFQMLHRARAAMDTGGRDAGSVVGAMRPPVNFKRKADVTRALQLWRLPKLKPALARIEEVAFQTRASTGLATEHIGTATIALTQMAAR